jgi:hypothetical protein
MMLAVFLDGLRSLQCCLGLPGFLLLGLLRFRLTHLNTIVIYGVYGITTHQIDFIAPIVMRQLLQVQEIRELDFRRQVAKLGYRLVSHPLFTGYSREV